MSARLVRPGSAVILALGLLLSSCATNQNRDSMQTATADGVVRVKSAYAMEETIRRIKQDVAAKGIMFFDEIDQSALARNANIGLRPSTLLIFGNPPLGTQFITSNPNAGLDWPVRLLVTQDDDGTVWAVYTDFEWIKQRHHIANRDPQFKMASEVIASITSSVAAKNPS